MSKSYHGLCTVFFSAKPITWKFSRGMLLDPPSNFLINNAPLDSIHFRRTQAKMNLEAMNYPHRVMSLGWEFLSSINAQSMSLETKASVVVFERVLRAIQKTSAPYLDLTHDNLGRSLVYQQAHNIPNVLDTYYNKIMEELVLTHGTTLEQMHS